MSDAPARRAVIVGLDSGSASVNAAAVDAETGEIVEVLPYERHHNEYETVARRVLRELVGRYDVRAVNVTGSTGQVLHRTWASTTRAPEVDSHALGIRALDPDVEAVLDGGGSEIKFFKIDREGRTYDFAMNPECAAGSGNFLDVQAKRLLLEIDDASDPARHFPTLGLEAIRQRKTVPISGRCSVFAKSDMIHQQQKAVPVEAIVGGLHESLVNNMKATVIQQRLKGFGGRLSFQGGLSQNASLRHCVEAQLGLEGRLVCHELGYAAGALGAALHPSRRPFDPADLDRPAEREESHHVWEPLTDDFVAEKGELRSPMHDLGPGPGRVRCYMGIDIGSVSTKIALVEERGEEVLAKSYLMTSGRPIEAVKRCLREIVSYVASRLGAPESAPLEEKIAAFDSRIEIAGVCTTGSGRFMTGHFLNADCIRNEITAQATGAVRLARRLGLRIDTIFEIGGQDSKYIRLDPSGGVRDYTMNKVCAAGCGSFLEEQAEKLAISIKGDFVRLALAADRPADLGDRCTVFIESVMDNLSGFGETRENLVAGLAYSVANNYLNRVVEGRDTGGNVFFQGGTAFNAAVTIAFQKVLKKPVWVTPHCEVTGPVGAACLAKDFAREETARTGRFATRFAGVADALAKTYESEERTCRICPNRCELQVVKVREREVGADGKPFERTRQIFYGDRCDEMNLNQGRGRTREANTLADQRNRILFDQPLAPRPGSVLPPNGMRVGIPRAMSMWGEHLPLWTRLFTELGFEVVLSPETSKATVRAGAALSLSDYCVPIRTGHGAVMSLLETDPGPQYVFVPHLITYPVRNEKTEPFACLWTQTFPIALRQAIDFDSRGVRLLAPIAEFDRPETRMLELVRDLSEGLEIPRRYVKRALARGFDAMRATRERLLELGRRALDGHGPEKPMFLVIGRGYNACDPALSLDIASKLGRLGHEAVPMDLLPLDEVPLIGDQENMYWKSGERILSAFKYASGRDWLIPVWITNFGCGPDSFIRKQVRHVMGERPYLELELDEHTADAGVITRIEAFCDSYANSLEHFRSRPPRASAHRFEVSGREVKRPGRVMAFCYMSEGAFGVAAVFRSRGLRAVVMPRTTPESLALGKRYSSGKECVPYQTTLGDKLTFLLSKEKRWQVRPDRVETWRAVEAPRPEDVVFFDPYAQGPCRFGQYNEGYKRVYEELGLDVRMLCSGAQTNYGEIFTSQWDATKFALVTWDAICAMDCLERARRVLRPVAAEPGEVDALYCRAMADLIGIVEEPAPTWLATRAKQRAILHAVGRWANALAGVRVDPAREADCANVGMFGEIYVRSEPFVNEFLMDKLEQYGIRTYLAPVNEWIQYVNYENLWDWRSHFRHRYGESAMNPFVALQKWFAGRRHVDASFKRRYLPSRLARFTEAFRRLPGWVDDPHVEDTISAGTKHVPFNVKGELILSWGLARELQHDPGIHGIVNIGPFGCMPSKVCSTLLHDPEITKPVFDAGYDGSLTNTRELKIETFASQVKAYARSVRETGRGPGPGHGAARPRERLRPGYARVVAAAEWPRRAVPSEQGG